MAVNTWVCFLRPGGKRHPDVFLFQVSHVVPQPDAHVGVGRIAAQLVQRQAEAFAQLLRHRFLIALIFDAAQRHDERPHIGQPHRLQSVDIEQARQPRGRAADAVAVADLQPDNGRLHRRRRRFKLAGCRYAQHFDQRLADPPHLRALTSRGVGATEVGGFKGDNLRLALEGAGSVKVNAQYRNVDVRLGGVGGMTVDAGSSDNVDLHLNGAGRIEMTGQTKQLHASLGGVGSLDAQQLRADTIDVNMSGLGSASVYAKNSANLKLTGLGSATVYGNPSNRSATARGLGSVSWQ